MLIVGAAPFLRGRRSSRCSVGSCCGSGPRSDGTATGSRSSRISAAGSPGEAAAASAGCAEAIGVMTSSSGDNVGSATATASSIGSSPFLTRFPAPLDLVDVFLGAFGGIRLQMVSSLQQRNYQRERCSDQLNRPDGPAIFTIFLSEPGFLNPKVSRTDDFPVNTAREILRLIHK